MALSNALHTKEITTAQVTAVSFGFFSEEEVRSCSHGLKASISLICMHPNIIIFKYELYGLIIDIVYDSNCCTLFNSQVRKISVKKVVSPIIFDNMKNPIKGGLYDPAFGPMDTKEK